MNEFVKLETMHGEAHIIRDSIKAFSCKEVTVNGKTVHRVGITCEVGATSKTLLYDIKSYDDYVDFRAEMRRPSRAGMATEQDTLEITGGGEPFYDWVFSLIKDPSDTPPCWSVTRVWHALVLENVKLGCKLALEFNYRCTRAEVTNIYAVDGHQIDHMQYDECLAAFVEDFVRPFAKDKKLVYEYSGDIPKERGQ